MAHNFTFTIVSIWFIIGYIVISSILRVFFYFCLSPFRKYNKTWIIRVLIKEAYRFAMDYIKIALPIAVIIDVIIYLNEHVN